MEAGWALGAAAAALLVGAPVAGKLASAGDAVPSERAKAQAGLTAMIERELRVGGSWFSAKEQAIIAAKCGYAPGEWDGYEANMSDDVFTCTNGRRVDDPEIRAVMAAARPRIERRVETVMARSDVRAAIGRVAEAATREAMARLEERR